MTLDATCRHPRQVLTQPLPSGDTCHVDGSSNDSFDHERPFWSPDEVSALLPPGQSSARVVARWCKRGQVPGAKKLPNGRWVIPAAWVRELLEHGGDPFAPPAPAAAAGSSDGVGVSPLPAPPDDPDERVGMDPLVEEP